jgi:hypothetical protein
MIADGHPWFGTLTCPQWLFLELTTGPWPMSSVPDQLAGPLYEVENLAERKC